MHARAAREVWGLAQPHVCNPHPANRAALRCTARPPSCPLTPLGKSLAKRFLGARRGCWLCKQRCPSVPVCSRGVCAERSAALSHPPRCPRSHWQPPAFIWPTFPKSPHWWPKWAERWVSTPQQAGCHKNLTAQKDRCQCSPWEAEAESTSMGLPAGTSVLPTESTFLKSSLRFFV